LLDRNHQNRQYHRPDIFLGKVMKQALYIPDANVRQMVEQAKHLHGFKSLRETVEEGMRHLMAQDKRTPASFTEIASALQEQTRQYLLSHHPSGAVLDHKAFFDELSGGM